MMVDMRNRKADLESIHFRSGSLPRNQNFLNEADKETEKYFYTLYHTQETQDG